MYSREDFEEGKCPKCGSNDLDESLTTMGLINAAFLFDSDYSCNKCGVSNEDNECYVATHVYGENAPELDTLRNFRDDVLKKNVVGRALVDFYYSGAGKSAAKMIEKVRATPVVRRGLDVIVRTLDKR
jgi:predicted RNA-binding Zn-ribbon protein involved in translation (DUF1610 family)